MNIIEIPKAIKYYENNKKDELLQWMKFLDNPKDMEVTKIMEENENIKEAKEELDRISQDDTLRRMAIKVEMEEFDHQQMMYEARRDGKAEGITTGKKEEKIEIAKKMLKEKLDIELICKVTELSKEEIEKMQNNS